MQYDLFSSEHEQFRQQVRKFLAQQVAPHVPEWEKKREIPRKFWKEMGAMGFLGFCYDPAYGGVGADDLFRVVMAEELARAHDRRRRGRRGRPQRHGHHLCQPPGDARAEAQMAYPLHHGGGRLRDRRDRARHRIGRLGHHDAGRKEGRPLHHQRAEDVHHQRSLRRPPGDGGQDRPEGRAGPPGGVAYPCRKKYAGGRLAKARKNRRARL